MSTEDRVQNLHATIALLLVYAICLASALISCHCDRLADLPTACPTTDVGFQRSNVQTFERSNEIAHDH